MQVLKLSDNYSEILSTPHKLLSQITDGHYDRL